MAENKSNKAHLSYFRDFHFRFLGLRHILSFCVGKTIGQPVKSKKSSQIPAKLRKILHEQIFATHGHNFWIDTCEKSKEKFKCIFGRGFNSPSLNYNGHWSCSEATVT